MGWERQMVPFKGKRVSSGGGGRPTAARGSLHSLQSWLPDVYAGSPERVVKYSQYDTMDKDSEVNTALDTIAEFSTQTDAATNLPFVLKWAEPPTESKLDHVMSLLHKWCRINDWDQRLYKAFRNVIKYGDQAFLRDPQTYELHAIDAANLINAGADESAGKKIMVYQVKNLSLNLSAQCATAPENLQKWQGLGMPSPAAFRGLMTGITSPPAGYLASSGIQNKDVSTVVDAEHVIHMALTDGMDINWPFGTSILEPVFKVYKQKELLEDALLIYRIQRAPERRVFYIDVGDGPEHLGQSRLEQIKNEVHQRRIPTKTGGGSTIMDAQYNPLSILDDYFFARSPEGKGSEVQSIGGDVNLDQINDLRYFAAKMARSLKIPSSYLSVDIDGESTVYQDGKLGNAFIEEFRFTQFCKRLQKALRGFMDHEFKMFTKGNGCEIETHEFSIDFVEPQNFSKYREIELEAARVQVFTSVRDVKWLSARFIMQKYLGLTEEEIALNTKWLKEETMEPKEAPKGEDDEDSGLSSVGVAGGGGSDAFASVEDDGPPEMAGGTE